MLFNLQLGIMVQLSTQLVEYTKSGVATLHSTKRNKKVAKHEHMPARMKNPAKLNRLPNTRTVLDRRDVQRQHEYRQIIFGHPLAPISQLTYRGANAAFCVIVCEVLNVLDLVHHCKTPGTPWHDKAIDIVIVVALFGSHWDYHCCHYGRFAFCANSQRRPLGA
jgi:hypothetical protein